MARTSEKAFNGLLAQALDRRHPRWDVNAEQTGVVAGSAGRSPDIVVTPHGGAVGTPVVIETEYAPARTVEQDAERRLGLVLADSGRVVEQVVALSAPAALRAVNQRDLPEAIEGAEYRYRLATGHGGDESAAWFPESGWLTGSVDDLAGLCEQIATNEMVVQKAADEMEQTVSAVSRTLAKAVADTPQVLNDIAEALHLEPSPQTTRIGVTMIANALVFQLAIEGDVDPETGWRVPGPHQDDTQAQVLENWKRILDINYWPIFYTAYEVLDKMPQVVAQTGVLPALTRMAQSLAGYGAVSTSDMAGQMFGKLIADRKFLATFYTRRESSRLLAELAVARMPVDDWSDQERVGSLKVADLACGTGALLAAAYDRMAARMRRAGADDEDLHPAMMENVMIGADIMPAAVHLTCTSLSALHPRKWYKRSGVHLMPYGRVAARDERGAQIRIGSLELLQQYYQQTNYLDTGDVTVMPSEDAKNDKDQEDEKVEAWSVVVHDTADLVIMNPPFTRPTNHKTAAAQGVPVPSFAGFGTDEDEQRLMAARLEELSPDRSVGHGNVGLASNFLDLAHKKIKPGGTIAFVLPLTVVSGADWAKARRLLTEHYRDICVVAVSSVGATDAAFSADTGMAEALIIATRRKPGEPQTDKALWITLKNRPANPVEAVEAARRIAALTSEERSAGTLCIGDAEAGSFARASLSGGAGYVGLIEFGLADCGEAMAAGRLWLPRLHDMVGAALVNLRELGDRGPYHLDIRARPPRGPFDVVKTTAWQAAEYPMLWAHNAGRETRLVVEPDRKGRIRDGMDAKAQKIWDTRSRLHFTLDFRLNSQPLAACFTPVQCIGGRAWPSFSMRKPEWEPAVLSWANTTLGLVAFWWLGSRQQRGRAVLSVTRLPDLPVLDPRALTAAQLDRARAVFDRFKDEEFLPANEAYRDPTRKSLDHAVLIDVLGLHRAADADESEIMESMDVLREQWCREPSVHGGKPTQPPQS